MMAGLTAAVCSIALVPDAHTQNLAERSFATEWTTFKRRFLAPDGRVIDTGNGGCSHSEGQGLGWCSQWPPVADINNATDGEIYIASAMSRVAAIACTSGRMTPQFVAD